MFIYCLFKWLISNSILLQQRISRRLVNLQIVAVACHRIHHNNPETGFYFQGVIPMCGKKGLELVLKFCRHPFLVILGHSLIEPVYGKIGIIQWNWRITVTKICRYFWFNIIHTCIHLFKYIWVQCYLPILTRFFLSNYATGRKIVNYEFWDIHGFQIHGKFQILKKVNWEIRHTNSNSHKLL